MNIQNIKSLLLITITIFMTGCFGPSNTAEEAVESYVKSMKEINYQSASENTTDSFKKIFLDKQKKAILLADLKLLSMASKYMEENKLSKSLRKCQTKLSHEEMRQMETDLEKYMGEQNIDKISETLLPCVEDKIMLEMMMKKFEASFNGVPFDYNTALEYTGRIIIEKILPKLDQNEILKYDKNVLWIHGNYEFSATKILKVLDINEEKKRISVEFDFGKYKRSAEFEVHLVDNKWLVNSINFEALKNNLVGNYHCTGFMESFYVSVKEDLNVLDFEFDGHQYSFKTEFISPDEILVNFKKNRIDTFKKTDKNTYIYNNTNCKKL